MTTAARKPKPTSGAKKPAKNAVAIESVGVRELRQNAARCILRRGGRGWQAGGHVRKSIGSARRAK
ncbi:MAG: hypothetical protein NTX60_03925 [Actinobacteria bacterium]|nr:hypothetical protein [Actinomycetota bacterium]